jgi:uncharacterized protein (DUF342 family)
MEVPQIFEGERFLIEVAANGLTATLNITAGAEVSTAAVIAKLKAIGIFSFDDGELIQALEARESAGVDLAYVVARGTPPVESRPGKVDFRVPLANAEQGLFAKVVDGQVIANVGAPLPGTDGHDVFGVPIGCTSHETLRAGPGTSLVKGYINATVAGNAAIDDGSVCVHPLFEVSGNDELLRRPLNFNGDVAIKSSLPEGRNLRIAGCLIVGGTIEAADFNVGGWMHVKGGIVGREKKTGFVGGDLWCRFASRAHLSVRGDVHVQNELLNSYLACTGRLTLSRGPISGGFVIANGGIECQILGNSAGVPTVIEAGTDYTLRTMVGEAKAEMEANRLRAAQIREKIAPLMARLKTLTPQQKEKATELLYEADQLDDAVKQKRSNLMNPCRISTERSKSEIIVVETIYPGVTIRFPGIETMIATCLKGPFKIYPRKSAAGTQVILEEREGTLCLLPSSRPLDGLKYRSEGSKSLALAA